MFLLRRPSPESIARVLDVSSGLSLSYAPVGLSRAGGRGFRLDELTIALGRGEADFARARAALRAWRHFDVGWVELHPAGAPIATGANVAVLIRHLGLWSLNGCRVVWGPEDTESASSRSFEFAYGTLANHAECGEESFAVHFDRRTGHVSYVIRAASRPRAALARLGLPVTRALQARFRRDSAAAMDRAVRS